MLVWAWIRQLFPWVRAHLSGNDILLWGTWSITLDQLYELRLLLSSASQYLHLISILVLIIYVFVRISIGESFTLVGLPVRMVVWIAIIVLQAGCSPTLTHMTGLPRAFLVGHQPLESVPLVFTLLDQFSMSLCLRLGSRPLAADVADLAVVWIHPFLKPFYVYLKGSFRYQAFLSSFFQNLLSFLVLELYNLFQLLSDFWISLHQIIINLDPGRTR